MNNITDTNILDWAIKYVQNLPHNYLSKEEIIKNLETLIAEISANDLKNNSFDYSQVEVIDEKGARRPVQPEDISKTHAQTNNTQQPPASPQSAKPINPQPDKKHKCAVIIYHREVYQRYQKEWVDDCIKSIRNQTYKEFDVLELNYGDDNLKLYEGSLFFNEKKRNFIEAMNTLLNLAFGDYDIAFNVNLDDTYDTERFNLQLEEVKKGAELVSSDFRRVGSINGDYIFHDKDIKAELNRKPPHNILCHPVICYTRNFWQKYGPYNPDSVKYEDMDLWQKAVNAGAKIHIVPKILCTQRIHNGNTGSVGEKH